MCNGNHTVRIYCIPGRHMTAVKGNSGVVYPFYKSTGHNSESANTWFPWMGYFAAHPNPLRQISLRHSIYMVKPNTQSVSQELISIIETHLGESALNFIIRMGNDEAIALSCSLGGGVWNEYTILRQDILAAQAIQPYLKTFTLIPYETEAITSLFPKGLTQFNGQNYSGIVSTVEARAAKQMEQITAEECRRYGSTYVVQAKKFFPTTDDLQNLMQKESDLIEVSTPFVSKFRV